ncbi:MAG: DUF2059 domain-containing protein, partial [Panacagrimonas sp.]
MLIRLSAIAGLLALSLLSAGPAMTQMPPAEAMAAARELTAAAKLDDQLKMILPMIMQNLKPAIVQGRPQVERDYDAIMPAIMTAMNARLGELIEATAALYAHNFTAEELREVAAFYRGPIGQKYLQKQQSILQQSMVL